LTLFIEQLEQEKDAALQALHAVDTTEEELRRKIRLIQQYSDKDMQESVEQLQKNKRDALDRIGQYELEIERNQLAIAEHRRRLLEYQRYLDRVEHQRQLELLEQQRRIKLLERRQDNAASEAKTLTQIKSTLVSEFRDLQFDKACKCCVGNHQLFNRYYKNTLKVLKNKPEEPPELPLEEPVEQSAPIELERVDPPDDSVNVAELQQLNKQREFDIERLRTQVEHCSTQIKVVSMLDDLVDLQRQLALVQENVKTRRKIANIKDSLAQSRDTLDQSRSNLERCRTLLELHNRNVGKKTKLRVQLRCLEAYLKCFSQKDGLPYLMVRDKCGELTSVFNRLLKLLNAPFTVEMSFEKQKFHILVNKQCSTTHETCTGGAKFVADSTQRYPASMASGSEKFIIDVIFRVAMQKIARINLPNILIIDEGFGCLDKSNVEHIRDALQLFKHEFDFLLIISHLRCLHNVADMSLNIQRRNHDSCIVQASSDV
jgi:predicted  nucleic acid-binding Zn-ribbon protein